MKIVSSLATVVSRMLPKVKHVLMSLAHVDFDLFQAVDGLEEVELGKGAIGTTKKGT